MLKRINGYISERIIIHISLGVIALWLVFYAIFITKGFVIVAPSISVLAILIPLFLIDGFKIILETSFKRGFHSGTEELDKLTVVIPTYNGAKVLGATLDDLLKKFKPEQIIVSSNGSTDNTCDLVANYKGVRVIETTDPIGKVNAINVALHEVKTLYTLIMDDDVLIGEAVFPTKPLGQKYSGIAFRVYPIISNWVTKVQDYEYRKSMDIGKAFQNKTATVQNISGAIGIFRTDELKRQVEIHTGEFCGEDLQRTLLIHLAEESKGVVIVDSVVKTEVPETITSLFKQRVYGWNPGMYSNFHNYIKILFKKNTPALLRYDAFYNAICVTLLDPIRLATLPLLVFYPVTALVIYAAYVLFEAFPYVALKQRTPIWVVLIYPFYGLFGFITRLVAFAVFLYRRFTVSITRTESLDDYRHARVRHRFMGAFASMVVVLNSLAAVLVVGAPEIVFQISLGISNFIKFLL